MSEAERRRIERRYKRWLEQGGKERLEAAMQRVKRGAEQRERDRHAQWPSLYMRFG